MGCQVCRARKVRCDGRLEGGCANCARLDLACDLVPQDDTSGSAVADVASNSPGKAKRTYRSCASCRSAKTKCNGDQPACLRCRARSIPCVYGTTAGPLWTRALREGQMASRGPPSPATSEQRHASQAQYSLPPQPSQPPPPPPPTYMISNGSPSLPSPSVSFGMDTDDGASPIRRRASSPVAMPGIPEVPESTTPGTTATDPDDSLAWLYSPQLPTSPTLLRKVVDHYFSNVHPLRCFAFVHKPTFMRQLSAPNDDDGFRLPASDSDDMALLQIVCAHGAKFCALEHSETTTTSNGAQPQGKRIQAAGHAWATAAEHTLMTHYGRITVTSLMTAVLLYDYRYRLGDFAHALVMSGLTTRMAHALQLNREYGQPSSGGGEGDADVRAVLSPVEKEARRRLMWACYVLDTWTGSGMDQLTLLREDDLHIQLPCNERDFLFQRPVTTGRLGDTLPPSDSGMMASYIRLVSIWKRVARYVKHLDTAALPWLPGSEFSVLDDALRAWREGLAPYLDFSPDSVYTRLESSQLGALALLHCTYYNAMLDLYRVGMPELFSLRHAFRFPPEQAAFRHHLQTRSFQHACRMATVLAQTAAQGARHLADSMTPMFAYNSSRVMLYYLVRLHDPARPDTQATVADTIRHVQSNNRVLQLASAMMPLSEPLLTTARHWLQKLQSGLDRQGVLRQGDVDNETVIPGMADDPASASAGTRHKSRRQPAPHPHDATVDADTDSADSSTDTPDNVLHPLSLFRLARKTLNDKAYTEPSSRASSYAGGGLPPLRDVVQSHRAPSPIPERERERPTNVGFSVPNPLPPAVAVPMYSNVPAAPTLNWENAFDDLATGLHVLQDYPHWDIHGFDHMNSNSNNNNNGPAGPAPPGHSVFDGSGLSTWPEYRKT